MAGNPNDDGVAQYRPERGLVLHGLPVHGIGAPQHRQRLMRRTSDEGIGPARSTRPAVVLVMVQPVTTFGRGNPATVILVAAESRTKTS